MIKTMSRALAATLCQQSNSNSNSNSKPLKKKKKWINVAVGVLLAVLVILSFSHFLRTSLALDLDLQHEDVQVKQQTHTNGVANEHDTDTTATDEKYDWPHDETCHMPIDPIISPTQDTSSRIINMGMPKSGSSSVHHLFAESGMKTSHFMCGSGNRSKFNACGYCFAKNMNKTDDNIFRLCGDYQVYTQMDHVNRFGIGCYFPQIQYLERLYTDAPHATWLMPIRNVSHWLNSVNKWFGMRKLYGTCNFRPHLSFGHEDFKEDANMMALYCNHIQQIRQFVADHPSLSLVEFRIEDENAGLLLAKYLPVNASYWGQSNVHASKLKTKKGH